MGKIPYMPLYIGDWEQDTNCLSIEAEGAWLKVVFKCWKNQGKFLSDMPSLARLCKITEQKFAAILLEWKKHDICNIEETADGGILIICRRHIKDIEISQKRALAGSKGGSKSKANTQAKQQQNPEYENEIEDENIEDESETFGYTLEENTELKLSEALDEIYLDAQAMKWPHLDFQFEYRTFCEKVRGSPDHYRNHDNGGIRLAFQKQLRESKNRKNGKGFNKNDRTDFTSRELEIIKAHVDRNKR